MLSRMLAVLAIVAAGVCEATVLSQKVQVNPIRKVVGMLTDMQKELLREKENEEELWEKVMCVCENGEKDLKKVIEDSTAETTELGSKIEEETSEKAQIDQELKEHYGNKKAAEGDLERATEIRKKESAEYSEHAKMNKFSIGALSSAIPQLESGVSSSSLMQQDDAPQLRRIIEITRYLTSDKREVVLNFLDDGLANGQSGPSAGASEIVGILKTMKDQMSKDLEANTESEKVAAAGYGDLKSAKQQEINVAAQAIAAKEKRSGALAVSLSESKDGKEDAEVELADAQKYLKALLSDCDTRTQQRGTRKKLRDDEIAAISEAISILTEDDSLDTFKKALPSASLLTARRNTYEAFMQLEKNRGKKRDTKLLQAGASADMGLTEQAAQFMKHPGLERAAGVISGMLKDRPSRQLSLLLTTLNGEIRADGMSKSKDPSGTEKYAGEAGKVVSGMIDSMVHVLHDEDVEDEHKKGWCANETEKTALMKSEKQDLTDQLSHSIDEMEDSLDSLKDEIKTVEDQIATNDKEVFESTELRKKEHQEFVDTFSTLDTARRLIEKAANRLHKFYNPEMMAKKKEAVIKAATEKAGMDLIAQKPPTAAVRRMLASFDSLVQKGRKTARRVAPIEVPDAPKYEKKESGGIIGLMTKMKEELTADMAESETEEKFSAKDYVRLMKDAQESRAQMVKRLTQKNSAKAELEEKNLEAKDLRGATLKELENLQLYIVQLGTECDFLLRNFEARHEGRVGEEGGLEEAKTIVTNEEPPTHQEIEAGFDAEKGDADVEAHFPEDGGHLGPGH